MPFVEQLVRSLDRRILELNREIASLEDARAALTMSDAAGVRARPPRRGVQPAKRLVRRRSARTRAVLAADTAEELLADGDGMTTAALAQRTGADRDQVLALLRDLETARRVRRSGQRRGTRWYAITDDDRIRERAAELASRPRGR